MSEDMISVTMGSMKEMNSYDDGTDVRARLLQDDDLTTDDDVEYERCRIKRDWEAEEGGSLISRSIIDHAMESEAANESFFTKIFTLTQMIGILCVVLTGIWVGHFHGGFSWRSNPKVEFNLHPLLMILGLIFLYANGALVYRSFRSERKKKLKIVHALSLLASFICTVVGLVAVFDSHNLNKVDGVLSPLPNMYTLHSWLGMAVVLLFACQWMSGLLTFLIPGLRPALRAAYLPIHQFFGMAIFLGAVATALMGIQEKAHWAMGKSYGQMPPEGVLVNVLGVLLVVFAGLVIYLTSNGKFRRRAAEDEVLLTDTVLE